MEGERTMKKVILAVIAVFVVWSVLDFVIHGLILRSAYASTASLWRPMNEMKTSVLYIAVLIAAITFVLIYSSFFSSKGISTGLKYGLLFGLGTGVSMGYGSYSVMPIPYHMALTWFLGSVVEASVGGIIVGSIIRK
jgi:predicted cobalt transporter CbtA